MFSKSKSLIEIIDDGARLWPDAPAIIDTMGTCTYAELSREVHALKDKISALVNPGSGVGVLTRNSRSFLVGLFATLGAGGVAMPLAGQLRREEVRKLLQDCPLHAILDDTMGLSPSGDSVLDYRSQSMDLRFRLTYPEDSIDKRLPFVPHISDPAVIRFTSGTTGKAKGVILSHQSVFDRLETAQRTIQIQPGEAITWMLPMAHHFVVSLMLYLRYGGCIVVCRDMLAQTILEATKAHQSAILYATPLHYRLLARDESAVTLDSLRLAISTSSGLSRDVGTEFQNRFGIPITQLYGIMEIGLPLGNILGADAHPESVGHTLPGYESVILDENMNEAGPGFIGQLGLRGKGMFDGYLAPAVRREEVFRNGWFLTGDLAARDLSGMITLMGRKSSLINIAGNKVFPEEVEAVLDSHHAVYSSRVYGAAHPLTGEIVCAELVLRSDEPEVSVEEIQRFCYERLSSHKVPKELRFVPNLPLTPTGKVVRHSIIS